MLLPVLTGMPAAGHHGHAMSGGLLVAGIHTLAMFVTATVIAVIVYEIVGVAILRKAWFNLDRMWAFALIGAGVFSLVGAV